MWFEQDRRIQQDFGTPAINIIALDKAPQWRGWGVHKRGETAKKKGNEASRAFHSSRGGGEGQRVFSLFNLIS